MKNHDLKLGSLGPIAISAAATLWLRQLLGRALNHGEIALDFALLGAAKSFRTLEWTVLAAVAIASVVAVVRRRPWGLVQIQAWALAASLFLTQYRLGAEIGKKVDWRLALGLVAGVAGLHCCYVCLLGQLLLGLWVWGRRRRLAQG